MDLPELINCSDDDDEGEFVDYCYNTLDSYASTLSIHTLNDYNESGFQNYQDENSAMSNNRNDFTVSDSCKKGYQSYNKIFGKNKIGSNLSSVISLLNFQASKISDQRQCITTKWNLGFNPTIQKFQFLVTELFDIDSSGFEFITISVKLPRNDPKKWHHYISHSSYQHIMASFHFRNLSTLQRLNNNIVSHEKECILTQVWLLDGTEKEVSTAVHRLDSLVLA
ncbi:uncharacterized protein KLLA0_C05456g [Kluyveromyces lactis]|uniref:KLLA0C05456p n=1 Tax=Kluyveromyces lactis (strain ATCC 8585 / CBS 2359 / DSM 70799 / NBRC 1267 / NRRL Y-1140 / WM37) TaxID=284590 RepID=Q6CUE7_KLULA|nr:uncharacterized protein KLLA0_C05456g [Kluyveromyces lactis]CAH01293.1 KLLA0C05456p [Kluyveromyces lactis]|eukprot:XP_452442.1 uncharacterized protein KLLA0_C05456g [Kluyveromyces lactis]